MKQHFFAAVMVIASLSAAQANPPLPPHNPLRQDAAQDTDRLPPIPRKNPQREPDNDAENLPPLPPQKPESEMEADAGDAEQLPPLPRKKPEREPPEAAIPVQQLNEPCGGALEDFAIVAERMPAIEEGACGREEVLSVTAVGTDTSVPLAAPATLSCNMAIGMAKWIGDAVIPAAKKHLGTEIAEIPAGTSYACRTRNHKPGAKLSEHAFANAFDVPGFKLADGKHINVAAYEDGTPQAEFMAEIRKAACGPFTTVLGPGTDEYHSDHFHFDTKERRNPYCK